MTTPLEKLETEYDDLVTDIQYPYWVSNEYLVSSQIMIDHQNSTIRVYVYLKDRSVKYARQPVIQTYVFSSKGELEFHEERAKFQKWGRGILKLIKNAIRSHKNG